MSLDWMNRAACTEVGTELFFPERGDAARDALAVCRGCPVQVECLDHARNLEASGPWPIIGIWGGTTGKARRAA